MIGFEEIIRDKDIHITNLAKEIGVSPGTIWDWFRRKVPDKHLNFLSTKFNVDQDYLNKIVNNLSTYKPKGTRNEYVVNGDKTIMIVNSKKGGRIDVEIDTEELGLVKDLSWFARLDRGRYYITTTLTICDIATRKYMTRNLALTKLIMGVSDKDIKVDHRDGDSLKNYKENLRCTSNSLNLKNRQQGKNKNNKSGYRNVFWSDGDNRWLVALQIDGKQKYFGKFKLEDIDKAGARAEEMRQKYYGEFAGIN